MKLFINAYFHSETYMGDFVKQEEEQGLLMMETGKIFTLAYFSRQRARFSNLQSIASPF